MSFYIKTSAIKKEIMDFSELTGRINKYIEETEGIMMSLHIEADSVISIKRHLENCLLRCRSNAQSVQKLGYTIEKVLTFYTDTENKICGKGGAVLNKGLARASLEAMRKAIDSINTLESITDTDYAIHLHSKVPYEDQKIQ